jgi:hypothetical protein
MAEPSLSEALEGAVVQHITVTLDANMRSTLWDIQRNQHRHNGRGPQEVDLCSGCPG